MVQDVRTILVTGATGYVGGRLIPRLLDRGFRVRCLVRSRARLRDRTWERKVEIVEGNALDSDSLQAAMHAVDVAYYLINPANPSNGGNHDPIQEAAENFGNAAREAGVNRLIFLGRIHPKTDSDSTALQSRYHVGDYLRQSFGPITEFRAALIIGSGSLSFELIRYLTERLPVLFAPAWMYSLTQPISVRNVLAYLVACLTVDESHDRIIEIGGNEVLSYADMVRLYAEVRSLKRLVIKIPVSIPRVTCFGVGLVTPIAGSAVKRIVEDRKYDSVLTSDMASELFNIKLLTFKAAVRRALQRFSEDRVDTMWTDAVSTVTETEDHVDQLRRKEGVIVERFHTRAKATPDSVFEVLCRLGGDTGWLYGNALWKIRGLLDVLAGGVGLRKTRRTYSKIRVGDTIDFWRVEALEDDRLIRLRAEMKVPGKAWLQYELSPVGSKQTLIIQTAFYEPRGLFGSFYWYLFHIPHRFIFPGLLRELKNLAELSEVGKELSDDESEEVVPS